MTSALFSYTLHGNMEDSGSNKVNCVGNSAWNPRSDKTTSQWRKWKEPSGRNQSRRKSKLFFFFLIKSGKGPNNIDGHTCQKKKKSHRKVALSTASDKFDNKLGSSKLRNDSKQWGVKIFLVLGKKNHLLMQMDELINKACRACCERRVNGENPRETLRACKPNQGAADCIQREEAVGALRNTKTRIWPRLHEAPVNTLKWRATGGICSMCS